MGCRWTLYTLGFVTVADYKLCFVNAILQNGFSEPAFEFYTSHPVLFAFEIRNENYRETKFESISEYSNDHRGRRKNETWKFCN